MRADADGASVAERLSSGLSRRQLLERSATLAGSAALWLAGCASSSHARRHQLQTQTLEVQLLNRSLDLEYETIAAYTAGIPLLAGREREAAKRFLDQELSHSGELAGLVKQAGGKPRRPRPAYDLGQPRSPAQILALLHTLERRQLTLYLNALPLLSVGSTRAAIGAVLANEAQHLAILRSQLRLDPLPVAIPSGAGE